MGKSNWDKVMKLAEEYGFITMAFGGVAILMSHEVQKEQGIYKKIQKINENKKK